MTPEALAQLFHETYERLAPQYHRAHGADPLPWGGISALKQAHLVATCAEVLEGLARLEPARLKAQALEEAVFLLLLKTTELRGIFHLRGFT